MNTENFDKAVPAIEVNGLTVKFPIRGGVFSKVKDYFTAVDNVSFTLPQGKILSIVGESGCGKSTLVKSLVGLVPVSSGRVNLFGLPVNCGKAGTGKDFVRVSDLVQMIFQKNFELYYKDIKEYKWTEVDGVDDLLKARQIQVESKLYFK
jgi:ABC-type oligopeptide transport system ATPase subunit